ncbi:hypothetical protein ACH5RR_012265 [Cinchona calisaya]|uniref:Uncharacterized protein n=1 Tax=Cinchona calisaya TaxID=153742 RepID=A0ABD3A789_9GENT
MSMEVDVELDVPNLIKLHYGGNAILQHLSFRGILSKKFAPRYISIDSVWSCIDASWFLKFNGIIPNLSPSKALLCIGIGEESMGDVLNFAADAIEVGELELDVDARSSTRSKCSSNFIDNLFSYFVDGLYWACHPKTIVQNWYTILCANSSYGTGFTKFLNKKLIRERRNDEELYNLPDGTVKFWEHDIKKVEFETYDKNGQQFCQQEPLDWNALPKASKILFKLEWQLVNSSSTPRKLDGESDALNPQLSLEN